MISLRLDSKFILITICQGEIQTTMLTIKFNSMSTKILLITLFMISSSNFAFQNKRQNSSSKEFSITGFVFNISKPLPSVSVINLTTNKGTTADSNGKYTIDAQVGDKLKFSHVGMIDEIRIVRKGKITVNVNMKIKVEKLEEVFVEKRKKLKKTQLEMELQYNTNPNLIKTQFGFLNKDTATYAMYILDEGEFNTNAPDFATAINGKFPYRKIIGSINTESQVVYELDGMVVSGVPPISPAAIRRIAYIPGLSAVVLYGNIARHGIFIINSKAGSYFRSPKKPRNYAQIKGNNYLNDAIPYSHQHKYLPEPLKSLYQTSSFSEAKKYFEDIAAFKFRSPYFIIESYNYFINRWKEKEYANTVLQENKQLWKGNVDAMKVLAFYMEMNQDFDGALDCYKTIFTLNPQDLQSYRNLAAIYASKGNYKKASDILLRYKHLVKEEFLSTGPDGISKLLERDFNYYSDQMLNISTSASGSVNKDGTEETRIVVEWNNSNSEFKIQFVNPQGRYFLFDHSKLESESRILEETSYGFSCEEFLIDESSSGTWLINGQKLDDRNNDNPIYLKITIDKNFGKKTQSSNLVKVFRLQEPNLNSQLVQIGL